MNFFILQNLFIEVFVVEKLQYQILLTIYLKLIKNNSLIVI